MKVLVTGANGFVGRALAITLESNGLEVVRAVRSACCSNEVQINDVGPKTDWQNALMSKEVGVVAGQREVPVDAVVHLAAKVDLVRDEAGDSRTAFFKVNAEGTSNLARQAAAAGVKRFVFLSSIKVNEVQMASLGNGGGSSSQDAYAASKWEAEKALWLIAEQTGMEVVIVRSPLMYGPGVKGNFLSLMRAIDKRFPLPFGAVQNRRSLIYVGNLIDTIRLFLTHPSAKGKTFLVSDADDVSTPELVRRIAVGLRRRPFLLHVPVSWMRLAGAILGKNEAIKRLLGSLTVETTHLQEELSWQPPYTMQEGLEATAEWYLKTKATQ
jgi:nucleoside-diphosphate-sugar epimerase